MERYRRLGRWKRIIFKATQGVRWREELDVRRYENIGKWDQINELNLGGNYICNKSARGNLGPCFMCALRVECNGGELRLGREIRSRQWGKLPVDS